jgi:hypothetical protein
MIVVGFIYEPLAFCDASFRVHFILAKHLTGDDINISCSTRIADSLDPQSCREHML